MSTTKRILFAGGGTGGHIYPALAVAEQLLKLDPTVQIHFLCSSRPIDAQILGHSGLGFTCLSAEGLGPGMLHKLRFPLAFIQGYRQAAGVIKDGFQIVVGVGGFVAAPACLAARRMGIDVYLINVDIIPGKANRLIARFARTIFVQFPQTKRILNRRADRVMVVGCPIRSDFEQPKPERARAELGLRTDLNTLLITGASSGSMNINRAICLLLPRLEGLKDGWQIVHITGTRHIEQVRSAYADTSLHHRLIPYYHHMADLYAACDLVIGRSGAVSVAEYAASGIPAICIPYPYHKDRHQYLNARYLVDAGAAVIVEDCADDKERAESLWSRLAPLLVDQQIRLAMSAAARKVGCLSAASQIAKAILGVYR